MLHVGSTIVLARLLVPEDFGLVAMASVIIAFVAAFKDAGLAMATVQRENITREQISTLFWLNLALTVCLGAVIVSLAPGVAWFYGRPELLGITIVLGLVFAVSGLSIQHEALLRRHMRFGTLAMIRVGAGVAGITVAITMALAGFGYWALVASQVVSVPISTLAACLACGWIPGLPGRGTGVRGMLQFGGLLASRNILGQVFKRFDDLIIGWQLGATPLGLYSKAYSLLRLPMDQIQGPIAQVAAPALSRLIGDAECFRSAYLRMVSFLVLIKIGIVAFLVAAAENVILFVLGEQWISSATVYRLLGGSALVGAITAGTGLLLIPFGRPGKMLVVAIVTSLLLLPGMVIGLNWGIVGVAAAVSIVPIITVVPRLLYVCHGTPVHASDFWRMSWRPLAAALPAGFAVHLIQELLPASVPVAVTLLLQVCLFGGLYIGTLSVLPGGRGVLGECLTRVRQLLGKSTSTAPQLPQSTRAEFPLPTTPVEPPADVGTR